MENKAVFRLWAKTTDDAKNYENAFHPLICHLVDVGVSAKALWKILPEIVRKRLAKPFDLENKLDKAGSLVSFLIALHDLGKCSPPFALSGKCADERSLEKQLEGISRASFFGEKLWKKYQTVKLLELYRETEFDCTGFKTVSDAPHNFVTSVVLPPILASKYKFPPQLAENIAEIIGGHHGTFPGADYLNNNKSDQYCGNQIWRGAQSEIVKLVAEVFRIDDDYSHLTDKKLDNATAMMFAGLTTVADWIGSNTDFFESHVKDFTKIVGDENFSIDLEKYRDESTEKANHALKRLGWLDWVKVADAEKDFDELFCDLKDKHRHLQDVAIEIAEKTNHLNEPGIIVVESPMGEGKTEAAMFLADAWNAKLKQRGIYFALPTQATSNQMFARIERFLSKRFPGENVHLLLQHGHASITAEFAEKIVNFEQIQNTYDDKEPERKRDFANVMAAEWFTYRKKGLLVPFGVGTIDQILLAVLQTKHVFVRLFGLAHKTVIVDEVHAYDSYMSTLLERLLEWLAALRSPVVLLSATLPKNRRNALVQAYLKGLGQKFEEDEKPKNIGEADQYPRISYATEKTPEKSFSVRRLGTSKQNTKTLRLEWKDENKFVDELKEKLTDGGCAAIICNTVERAQKLFEKLEKDDFFKGAASDDLPKLDLLHARFRYLDRKEREENSLKRFAAPAQDGEGLHRPHTAVLISTQIIEQSLDLDFDLMISELAPADLLLQRAGRLQRHKRSKRPSKFLDEAGEDKPTLWIIEPETDENRNLLSDSKGLPCFGKSGAVYDKHILLRSWLKLRKKDAIEIPGEIEEMIEDVYDLEKVFENLNDCQLLFWQKTLEIYEEDCSTEKDTAQSRYIKHPRYSGGLDGLVGEPREEDAPELHPSRQVQTRLIEPTANVVCLWEKDEKTYIDENFKEVISLNKKPNDETAKKLLYNSLSVSSKSVVFDLLRKEIPPGWEKSALLRRHRALKFNEQRKCEMFGYVFHLDEKLGLKIFKEEK